LNKDLTSDDVMLLQHIEQHSITISHSNVTVNSNIYPSIALEILSKDSCFQPFKNMTRIVGIAKKIIMIQHDCMFQHHDPNLQHGFDTYLNTTLQSMQKYKNMRELLTATSVFETLVKLLPNTEIMKGQDEDIDSFNCRRAKLCSFHIKELQMLIVWSRNTALIQWREQLYILPRIYLLMIHNKLADITSVLLLALSYPYSFFQCNAYEQTLAFIKLYLRLAVRYNQKFFEISKVLEALVIGESLAYLEGESNKTFLDTVVYGLHEACKFMYYDSSLHTFLSSCSVPFMHELSCLSKICGHPFCDIEGGACDLKKKVTEHRTISLSAVHQSVRYAKQHFIRSFIKRHGRWPLVEIDRESKSLTKAMLMNKDPQSIAHQRRYGLIKIEDYDAVTLKKNMEFDWVENFIPYIKDRTVSLLKSETLNRYIEGNLEKTDWRSTRALLAYLLWPARKCNHMDYLQSYVAGDWEMIGDYLIIRIVPKEKEHKIKARGFGCKTLQDRARSIIQELNSAEFLDQYSDEHAMTQGEIPLLKKLYAYRHMSEAYTGYKMILINVDASSWNNRFRHQAVAPLMSQTLDAIFDTPIFSKTHQAYQKSFIYMPDAGRVYWWDGQEGGIEGLNQDTWVVTYISQIKVCMEKFQYPYHILCKGDDLRVAVLIPPQVLDHTSIEDLKRDILMAISEIGDKFGHVIKVEDSYASECYFAFSKNTYIGDTELSQSYRKIQKCYGANNSFINTIDDHVACSFSNAHSAAKTSPSPISCYIVAVVWCIFYLMRHDDFEPLADNELVSLLLIPNVLGCFPIIYLHNFLVRAESDLLTAFLHIMQYCKNSYPDIYSYLVFSLKQVWLNPDDNLIGLMIDPYSLPLKKPPVASGILRQSVLKLVESATKNEAIKELFNARKTEFMRVFVENLRTCNVYNAKIMSALYSVTPDGIINELIRKFESGRSIFELLILQSGRRRAVRILSRVVRADVAFQRYKVALIKGLLKDSRFPNTLDVIDNVCSTELAYLLRKELWEKDVVGITQPVMQHMIHVGPVEYFEPTLHNANCHFEYVIDYAQNYDKAYIYTHGDYKPFLGATTGSGLGDPEAKLISKNIFALKLHDLLDVFRWSFCTLRGEGGMVTSNLHYLIEDMIVQYTGKSLSSVAPFTSKRVLDKTVQHHVRANQYKTSVVPNTLTNVYSRVKGYSYAHLVLRDDTEHYLVNFHQIYCHAVSLAFYNAWCGCVPLPEENRIWAVTTECQFCMTAIEEIPIIITYKELPRIEISDISSISATALRKINQELSDYNPTEFQICSEESEGFNIFDAQAALLQHFINTNLCNYIITRDYYTGHELTTTARLTLSEWEGSPGHNLLGVSEVRQMSVESIFLDSSILICGQILSRHTYILPDQAYTVISTVPSNEHEWIGLLKSIDEAGLLFEMQTYLLQIFPDEGVAVYESYHSFSAMYGYLCYLHSLQRNVHPFIYVLSTKDNANIPRHVQIRSSCYQRHILFRNETHLRSTIQGNPIHELHLALRIVFLCFLQEWDNATFVLNEAQKTMTQSLKLFEFDDINDISEMMELWLEDVNERNETYVILTQCIPGLPYITAMEEISALTPMACDVFELLRREYAGYMLDIKRSDIITCKNIISSYQLRNMVVSDAMTIPGVDVVAIGRPEGLHTELIRTGADQTVYTSMMQSFDMIPYEEEEDATISSSWSFQDVGYNNVSSSRLLQIFNALSISFLPSNSTYACFADGYGGYCHVISEMTNSSVIVFNTKPLSPESNPKPLGAMRTQVTRQNQIDVQALDAGYYDITSKRTFQFFIEHNRKRYTLITCDLEMVSLNESYYQGLEYFLSYAVSNTIVGGLIVCKVYGEDPNKVCRLVGKLIGRCTKLILMKSRASMGYGEFYIVAIVASHEDNFDTIISEVSYPPGIICMKINRFLIHLQRDYQKKGGDNLTIQASTSHLLYNVKRRLPCYGWSKLAEVTKIVVPSYLHDKNGRAIDLWARAICENLRGSVKRYYDEIDERVPLPSMYDTMMHKHVILLRLMQLSGAMYVYASLEATGTVCMNFDAIRRSYRRKTLTLPNTMPMPETFNENPFEDVTLSSGKKVNLFVHYISGVKWAWSTVIYAQ
ncbi:RNA-dependent RNA polymerase, partial [dermapteran chu-related virus 142]